MEPTEPQASALYNDSATNVTTTLCIWIGGLLLVWVVVRFLYVLFAGNPISRDKSIRQAKKARLRTGLSISKKTNTHAADSKVPPHTLPRSVYDAGSMSDGGGVRHEQRHNTTRVKYPRGGSTGHVRARTGLRDLHNGHNMRFRTRQPPVATHENTGDAPNAPLAVVPPEIPAFGGIGNALQVFG